MHTENRRSFVKKSLATSVSISFSGLIRAHGEEGGGTTWNPDETTIMLTTTPDTTYPPSYWETTVASTETCTTTYNPDETTAATTIAPSSYRFFLGSVDPEASEQMQLVQFAIADDCSYRAAQLSVEVHGGEPLGGFPEEMENVEFFYGLTAVVAVTDDNGQLQEVAKVYVSVVTTVELPDPESAALSVSAALSEDYENDGGVLPVLSRTLFTYAGIDYELELIVDYTHCIDSDIGKNGIVETFASGKARLTRGANVSTGTRKVTHTFLSIIE